MILRKVVEYYVFFICAKSRHCSWKSTRDIFVYVCFSVFVHVNCATDHFFDNNRIYQMYMYCGTLSSYERFPLDFCIHLSSTSPFSCTVLVISQHALLLHAFFLLSLPTNSILMLFDFEKFIQVPL